MDEEAGKNFMSSEGASEKTIAEVARSLASKGGCVNSGVNVIRRRPSLP